MKQKYNKCILPYFAAHFAVFCGSLSRAKAVPLHRISKRDEIESTNQLINLSTKNHGICRNDSFREQLRRKAGFYAAQQSGIYAVLPRCSRSDAGGVSERYLRHPQRRYGAKLQPPRRQQSTRVLQAPRQPVESQRQMVHLLPRLAHQCRQLTAISRKCNATPPPPSKRGEGVRGGEEDSASSRIMTS